MKLPTIKRYKNGLSYSRKTPEQELFKKFYFWDFKVFDDLN